MASVQGSGAPRRDINDVWDCEEWHSGPVGLGKGRAPVAAVLLGFWDFYLGTHWGTKASQPLTGKKKPAPALGLRADDPWAWQEALIQLGSCVAWRGVVRSVEPHFLFQ